MTRFRFAWIPAVLVGLLAAAASAEMIRCPHHDEPDPQWNRGANGATAVAGRMAADPAPQMLETAHFAIFYHTTGVHAVAGAAIDRDGNGHPDNVDSIGAIAERVWRLSIDTLEYLKPNPYDTTLAYQAIVPIGKFPIEVIDIVSVVPDWGGKRYMGYATRPSVENRNRQQLVIENDFVDSKDGKAIQVKVDPINTNGTDSLLIDYTQEPVKGWKVGISHDFYHNLQHRYDASYLYGFHEMTAVWYATRCYPDVKHHWMYYPGYLKNIHISAFDTYVMGAAENFPFITAMTSALGEGILKDLWSVRKKTFTGGEDYWIRDAFDSLKVDVVPFSKLYVQSVLELAAGVPGLLNEQGTLKVNPKIEPFPLIRQEGSGTNGAQPHGIELRKLHPDQFKDGWNMRFDPTTTYSSAGWVRLPSGKVEVYRPTDAPVIVGASEGDTAWYFAIMSAPLRNTYYSVDIRMTQTPITSVRRRAIGLRPAPQYRVDLQGRPVRAGTRGIILEGAPSTGWTRAVKMGE